MTDLEHWGEFDIAQNKLDLAIGSYSECIYLEQRKPSPDLEKISRWEKEQDELIDERDALDVSHTLAIALINSGSRKLRHFAEEENAR